MIDMQQRLGKLYVCNYINMNININIDININISTNTNTKMSNRKQYMNIYSAGWASSMCATMVLEAILWVIQCTRCSTHVIIIKSLSRGWFNVQGAHVIIIKSVSIIVLWVIQCTRCSTHVIIIKSLSCGWLNKGSWRQAFHLPLLEPNKYISEVFITSIRAFAWCLWKWSLCTSSSTKPGRHQYRHRASSPI